MKTNCIRWKSFCIINLQWLNHFKGLKMPLFFRSLHLWSRNKPIVEIMITESAKKFWFWKGNNKTDNLPCKQLCVDKAFRIRAEERSSWEGWPRPRAWSGPWRPDRTRSRAWQTRRDGGVRELTNPGSGSRSCPWWRRRRGWEWGRSRRRRRKWSTDRRNPYRNPPDHLNQGNLNGRINNKTFLIKLYCFC